MRLHYGKYKGDDITDVPVDYLQWMEANVDLSDDERVEINHEIERRMGDRPGAGRVVSRSELERKKHGR